MGSNTSAGKVQFTVIISDDENIINVELITNGGKVVKEQNFGNSTDSR